MPTDRNGRKLRPGDTVMIPAIITGIDEHDGFINVAVETIEPMHPGPNKTPIALNTKQVELYEKTGHTDPESDVCKALSASSECCKDA